MLETIYVVRHGFRSNWIVDPTTGDYHSNIPSPTGIKSDPALAAYGVSQSQELAEHLVESLEPKVDVVYSSPFYRCLQTLKPATDKLFARGKAGGKIRVENGIGEFYGRARFDHPSPATLDVLEKHFSDLDTSYKPICIPSKKGESIKELHERVAYTLDRIITELDHDPKKPRSLLICTHAACMIVIGRVLTGQMPADPGLDDFQCFTCSLSQYNSNRTGVVDPEEVENNGSFQQEDHIGIPSDEITDIEWRGTGLKGGWKCVKNGACGFLSGGAERGWDFTIEDEQYRAEVISARQKQPGMT